MTLPIGSSALEWTIKLTLVLSAAWLASAVLARANPRWQVGQWRVTAVSIAVLLITALLPPLYNLSLLPRSAAAPAVAEWSNQRPRAVNAKPVGQQRSTEVMVAPQGRTNRTDIRYDPITADRPIHATMTSRSTAHVQPSRPPVVTAANSSWSMFSRSAIHWRTIGMTAYGFVLACLLLRLLSGMVITRRVLTEARPAPDWLQALADSMTQDTRCAGLPVKLTSRLSSPVLIGLRRPVILLPDELLESASAALDVRAAVAHEVAHAMGNDLIWDRLLALICAVVWPHPLAWRMRAAHRAACDRLCDRLAADAVDDVHAYQRLLARIALSVAAARTTVGLAMARRADVCRRLTALEACPAAPRLGHNAFAAAAAALGAVVVLSAGSLVTRPGSLRAETDSPAASSSPANVSEADSVAQHERAVKASPPTSLKFSVVRSDNAEPLAGAKISVHMYAEGVRVNKELTTDATGIVTFEYPDADVPATLWCMVEHVGMVPYYVNFGRDLIPASRPADKTIRMDPGKLVGGTVVDQQGNAVAGAQVSIVVPATDTPSEIHYHLLHESTTATGKWLLDSAPLDHSGLSLVVEHPRFIRAAFPVQEGLDGRYVLDPGLTLTGRVTDAQGAPVADAHVTVGRDRFGSIDKPIPVAADGTFAVPALRPQATWVTVEAPGFAPQVQAVELNASTEPLDFALAAGHTTHFQVVDSAGQPIAGVRIVADKWKEFRSLWWDARTDAEGRATWNGAPPEAVEFHVLGNSYAARRDVVVGPREQPHIVQLHKPLQIHGRVTDANGRNIDKFRAGLGMKINQREGIYWITRERTDGRNGEFQLRYDEQCEAVYVRIEATGFSPWVSEALAFQDSPHELSVRLQAGSSLAGTVWTPDGQPANGARLTLLTESEGMQFTRGYQPIGGKQTVVSDVEGQFQFLPTEEPALIVAVHDSGYAEVTPEQIDAQQGIQLAAWARIRAIVRRGDKYLSDAKVDIDPQSREQKGVRVFSYGIRGTTSADGVAEFERVVPRQVAVYTTIEQPIGSGTMVYPERSVQVTLQPGQTAQVVLGGTGSAVVGKFQIAGQPPEPHKWSLNDAVNITTMDPSSDVNGREYYRCLIAEDGSFRADDIPPGRYELTVNLTAAPAADVCGHGAVMGRIQHEFTIEPDGGVVDLGTLEGTWFDRLAAGDQAPQFVAQGLQGEPVRLSQLRGRLVLIDFWATWCGPCMAEMPQLAELHSEFSDDARFAMLGVSLDSSFEECAATVSRNNWPWLFAYAGPGTQALVPMRYEVRSIPEKFLIDVDGTILYRGRDLQAVRALVRERLAQLPAEPGPVEAPPAATPVPLEDPFVASASVAVALAVDNYDYSAGSPAQAKGAGLILAADGGVPVRQLDDVLTSGWLSGPQRVAIDAQRERLYFCDALQQSLIALDRAGRKLYSVPIADLHAVCVDEKNGDIWCLALPSLVSGELLILDVDGHERTRLPLTAFALAYSPVEDAFWLVGKTVIKVNREGQTLSSQPLPDHAYTWSEVVVDRERGGAWATELDHPDNPGSANRLWRIAPDGTATIAHRFGDEDHPRSLACIAGAPWVVVHTYGREPGVGVVARRVQQFTRDGAAANALNIVANDIAVGQTSGSIWFCTHDSLMRVDEHGHAVQTTPLSMDGHSVHMVAY